MLVVQERAYPYRYKKFKKPVTYQLTIKDYTKESSSDILENEFSQTIEVYLAGEDGGFEFDITVCNEKYKLDTKIVHQEKFIQQLAALTQHVQVLVDSLGNIVAINNHKSILKKWDKLKPQLAQNNKGAIINAYIEQIEAHIKNKTFFVNNLNQYRLFGLVFNGFLNIPFDDERIKTRQRTFEQTIRSIPVTINETVKLVGEKLETDLLEYQITGKLSPIDKADLKRINAYFEYFDMPGSSIYLQNYLGSYTVNKYTAWTECATIQLQLTNGRGYERNVVYKLTKKN